VCGSDLVDLDVDPGAPICGCGGGGGGGADVDVDPPLLVFVFPEADPNIDMGSIIGSSKEVLSSSSTLMPMLTLSTVLKTTEMARNFHLTHHCLTPTTVLSSILGLKIFSVSLLVSFALHLLALPLLLPLMSHLI